MSNNEPILAYINPRKNRSKFDWNILAVVIPLVLAIIGWSISIEVRMSKIDSALDLSQRVKTIEDVMTPVVIDWKVWQEMKKRGLTHSSSLPAFPSPMPTPPVPPAPSKSADKEIEEIHNNAKNWVQSQIRPVPSPNQEPPEILLGEQAKP